MISANGGTAASFLGIIAASLGEKAKSKSSTPTIYDKIENNAIKAIVFCTHIHRVKRGQNLTLEA
jgi:hypothetical protein